jgi:hypothetical protein
VSNRVERPLFFENQILGAADLTAAVDHERGQQARHDRFLHLWGIAFGLELTGEDKKTETGIAFKEVKLSAGMAIDGTGREIVVPQAELLSETLFDQLNIVDQKHTDALYPIFLLGRDRNATQPALATGACNNSLPIRVEEDYEITFGRPGTARDLDAALAPNVADGPGNGTWKVLLGFVNWDKTISKFTGVSPDSDGIGRRYAGVQADEVAARGGTLKLRTRTRDQAKKPAIVLDETDGGLLQFGLLTTAGKVAPVFTVNAKGDVTAEGRFASAVTPGSVQVQSGVAMDGALLPLPPGIDPEDIASGKFTLYSHFTPHITQDQAPNTTQLWGAVPLNCLVESDRRIRCQLRWFVIDPAATTIQVQDRAALCDYTVIVSVPATTGNQT